MKIPPPKLELIAPSDFFAVARYKLTEDWTILLDDGFPLFFPRGFETDLASIPRALWSIPGFSPTGPLRYGSIPHDLGYQYQYLLSPYRKNTPYPEPSLALRERYPFLFSDLVPVFVGRNQRFFDDLLAGITIEVTGARFIAKSADLALKWFGDKAWDKYRTIGPTAFNANSLGLPGVTRSGVAF